MTLLTTWPTVTNDTGTKTDGTLFNQALTDAMKSAIEAVVHSTTNPTITPEDIIDEVKNARGSLSTLDARLDVSLNEDGTLKSQAGTATNADLQAATGARNVSKNSNLCSWSAGAAAAPDNHTLTGAGATIARTGAGEADTFTFGAGCYSLKITRAGTDAKLTQAVIAAADMAAAAHYKGNKVGVIVYAKTSIASHARLIVDDGVTTSNSGFHTGGGAEEKLTVTHTISASATKLDVYVEVVTSNGAAYFSGYTIVFADLAPDDWKPLSGTDDASATVAGIVNLVAQTFAGAKTFNALTTFSAGTLGAPTYARCTADLTKNANTTLSNITGLTFSVGANEVWAFQFLLRGITTSVADWKLTLTGPAAPTAVWFGLVTANQQTTGTKVVTAFGSALSVDGIGTEDALIISGLLQNGANAGAVQAQMAQLASEATNTVIRADSYVLAWRIS